MTANAFHTCAILNGAAKCWGANFDGILGNDSTTNSSVPVQVSGLESEVTAIAAGYTHTCAIHNGAAKCWGSNFYGQLGNDSTTNSSVPVQVSGLESGVTAIAAGDRHTCAIHNGAAKCWGYNQFYGQLGNNSTTDSRVPVQVSGLESEVTAIASGSMSDYTCAIQNGAAKCWGEGTAGQLGDGNLTNSGVPVQVSGMESGVTVIGPGKQHTCVVHNGVAKCWGYNNYGQLGNGTVTPISLTPVLVGWPS